MAVQGLSILTNVAAMDAQRELAKTQRSLAATQLRVTTGLKVNAARRRGHVRARPANAR